MALDAAVVIRAGSASLFVLLGIAVLMVGRRKAGAIALGLSLTALGLNTFMNNITGEDNPVWLETINTTFGLAFGLAAIAVTVLLPTPATRRESGVIASGAFVACVYAAGLFGSPGLALPGSANEAGIPQALVAYEAAVEFIAFLAFGAAFTIVSARVAFHPPEDPKGLQRAFALFLPISFVVVASPTLFGPTRVLSLSSMLAIVAFPAACWLVAAARTGRRFPALVALLLAALGLFAYAYLLVPGNHADATFDIFGLYGVLRIVGWVVLVHAIVRLDLLAVPLPRVALSRGTIAAGALATLFIVAQVAQNFLSAQYGLLMGGVVAGAFVFAASPIQRAIERGRDPAPVPANVSAGGEASYRKAVRRALRDKILSREEMGELHELARDLGIDGVRAHAIMVEAEGEQGREP